MSAIIKLLFIFSILISCERDKKITIHLIGDSTMSDKPGPDNNPERGWGQVLASFFNDRISVRNYAVNGRSTKSFMDEGKWQAVLDEIKKDDYVFIQFGHNDQKLKDPRRYTNPLTGYKSNLIKYVNDSREKGGIPVLLSPVVRRNFNEYGVLVDTHGLYPLVMKQVADELNVLFIDLQSKSENLVLALGPEKSKELYLWVEAGHWEMYPDGKQDNTHFSLKGATEIARLVVEGLQENKLGLVKYLRQK